MTPIAIFAPDVNSSAELCTGVLGAGVRFEVDDDGGLSVTDFGGGVECAVDAVVDPAGCDGVICPAFVEDWSSNGVE